MTNHTNRIILAINKYFMIHGYILLENINLKYIMMLGNVCVNNI